MTEFLRAIVTVPHASGLPRDAVVNSWAFTDAGSGTRDSVAALWTTALNTFYGAIKNQLSSAYAWNNGTIEYIDMADGKPRVPYKTDALALGTLSSSNADLPAEVSVCLSFRGAQVSGLNARRRRGRVYLGPLQQAAGDQVSLATANADTIAAAANALKGTAGVTWCVYSRYTHHGVPVGENIRDYPDEIGSQLDDSFIPVATIWVDNAYDIQRRRGPGASYRKTY